MKAACHQSEYYHCCSMLVTCNLCPCTQPWNAQFPDRGADWVPQPCRYYGLKPDVKVIAPWREWDLNSRTKLIKYAEEAGIEVPSSKRGEAPFSTDANLLHISYEGWGLRSDSPRNGVWIPPLLLAASRRVKVISHELGHLLQLLLSLRLSCEPQSDLLPSPPPPPPPSRRTDWSSLYRPAYSTRLSAYCVDMLEFIRNICSHVEMHGRTHA